MLLLEQNFNFDYSHSRDMEQEIKTGNRKSTPAVIEQMNEKIM